MNVKLIPVKNKLLVGVLTIILIVFLQELRIHPFDTPFRIGLGVIAFAFAAVYLKKISLATLSLGVAALILLYRTSIDILIYGEELGEAALSNLPGAFYYIIFGLLIQLFQVRKLYDSPILQGLILGLLDFGSNMIEVVLRWTLVSEQLIVQPISFKILGLLIIGLLRMLFVTGVYSSIRQHNLQAINAIERKKRAEILLLTSNLQAEVFFLQKSTQDMEDLITNGYDLYHELLEEKRQSLSQKALNIATNTHEIKKDYERINAGLRKLLNPSSFKGGSFQELVDLIINANKDYLKEENKEIHLSAEIDEDFYPRYPLMIVSIINNLIINAIEAIPSEGSIDLKAFFTDQGQLQISIKDNGVGISEKEQQLIFEPGFTKKKRRTGKPSTGVGLSHVKRLVGYLNGDIHVISEPYEGTEFIITFHAKAVLDEK